MTRSNKRSLQEMVDVLVDEDASADEKGAAVAGLEFATWDSTVGHGEKIANGLRDHLATAACNDPQLVAAVEQLHRDKPHLGRRALASALQKKFPAATEKVIRSILARLER